MLVDLGTLPDWITSLATIGALLAAIYAGRVARELYQRESDRDDLDRHDRLVQTWLAERRQAERVVAWIGDATAPLNAVDGRRLGEVRGRVVNVLNNSGLPVWNARVLLSGTIEGNEFEGEIIIPLLALRHEAGTAPPDPWWP